MPRYDLETMPIFGTDEGPLRSRDPASVAAAREQMVTEHLLARGIHDPRVLEAFRRVRREDFVDAGVLEFAYDDRPLAIGEGQTISQPYIVAYMATMLGIREGDRVLEVGTGSGYAAAIFAALGGNVVGIERLEGLAMRARANLAKAGFGGVRVIVGDGTTGAGDLGPFDAIAVSAGGPSIPPSLVRELAPGGRMVIPVGPDIKHQELVKVERSLDGEVTVAKLCPVHFVRLIGQEGWPAT